MKQQASKKTGSRRNLYIYDEVYEALIKIGHGNASAGVRRLVEDHQKQGASK